MRELRILVTTDNHLGFMERDHIRGEDSFRAFEEVFDHARRAEADCILICGDLFHEASPSKYSIYRAMSIFRKNCIGGGDIDIECIDNGFFHRHAAGAREPNYYSEDINVKIPVFAIHGNHDEPSGHRGVSPLDIFAEAGVINYFGRIDSTADNIVVPPITLRKEGEAVNIYGIGGIRDERMARLFAEGRIALKKEDAGLNFFVLHQNRCGHASKSYIPEHLFSKDLDLVIWGHEHESKPVPEKSAEMGFLVLQPGSTVQTSLSAGESPEKHCVLIRVKDGGWSAEPIKMATPRKLLIKTLAASLSEADKAESRIREELQGMLAETAGLEGRSTEKLPLLRLRVEIDGALNLIPRRLLEEFKDKVANPRDILRIVRRRRREVQATDACPSTRKAAEFALEVEGVKVLPERVFSRGISECIEREDKGVIGRCYEEIVRESISLLKARRWPDIGQELAATIKEVEQKLLQSISEAEQAKSNACGRPKENREGEDVREMEIDMDIGAEAEFLEERVKKRRLEKAAQGDSQDRGEREDFTFAELWE